MGVSPPSNVASTPCPGTNTVLDFVRGTLSAEARRAAEAHAAECDLCRVLISDLARARSGEHAIETPRDVPTGFAETELATFAVPAPVETKLPVVPGMVIAGKYEVEEVLGAGGMGYVLAARHAQLKRRVALKLLLPELAARPDIVARFLREARAAAKLESDHVVKVLDVDVLPTGAPYIVMEYLEGVDLSVELERHGKLALREAVGAVIQACEALLEAHEKGLIHRDLKPANLFFVQRGDGRRFIKVLDFGIAKSVGPGSDLSAASTANDRGPVILGTPRYMSPEQARGTGNIDARSDVWALGVVLYELLSGRPAFDGAQISQILERIATEPAPPLGVKGVPAAVEQAILRCLAKNPDARFQNVADLAMALAPYAPKDVAPILERLKKSASRPTGSAAKRAAFVAIGVGVAALIALAVALRLAHAPSAIAPTAEPVASNPAAHVEVTPTTPLPVGTVVTTATPSSSAATTTSAHAPSKQAVSVPVAPHTATAAQPAPTAQPTASQPTHPQDPHGLLDRN
jgi:serine/threonine-protein kinase